MDAHVWMHASSSCDAWQHNEVACAYVGAFEILAVGEGSTNFLQQDWGFIDSHEDAFALAFARIECHYFVNGGFFEVEDQLLRDAHRIKAPQHHRARPL